MPKTRRRLKPITGAVREEGSSKPQVARKIIRRFHVLQKRRAQLESSLCAERNPRHLVDHEKQEIDNELDALGGLERYQRMSSYGQDRTRGGGSEKVFGDWLLELGLKELHSSSNKLRLLEVGSLMPDNYDIFCTWMEVMPIDLNPRKPGIVKQDFFLLEGEIHVEQWDAISLSLVLNFVPDCKKRGQMLQMCHQFLKPDGLLFVALPSPCVLNSRYLDSDRLNLLMRAIGFVLIEDRVRIGGKMGYWLYRKTVSSSSQADVAAVRRKEVLTRGAKRNNFAVLLS